ncbi:MAG: hypothetical protein ACRC7N_15945, partial [Clostridium sp.]
EEDFSNAGSFSSDIITGLGIGGLKSFGSKSVATKGLKLTDTTKISRVSGIKNKLGRELNSIHLGIKETFTGKSVTLGSGMGIVDDVVNNISKKRKSLSYQGAAKPIREQMLESSSAKLWGTLQDGTNQGVKHFADYWEKYPERIPSLAERLGVDASKFENTVDGFNNFTEQVLKVKNNGILREPNGKQIYYLEGATKPKKGVVVIFKDGKIQSMMPSDIKSFNKLE